jgi:hypothetical protein
VQIVAFGRAGKAEHNEIEGKDSRDQNRRGDVHSTSNDERGYHQILLRTNA